MATPAAEAPQISPPKPEDVKQEAPAQPQQHKHKSWRKKYYKQRHRFQQLMTSNNLEFEREQKAIRTARRLQEQNDQLLDLLLDINKAPNLPQKLRYDIRSPVPSAASHPISTTLIDDTLELEDSLTYNPLRSLSRLEASVPHTSSQDLPTDPVERKSLEDFIEDETTGYLSPLHEDEYLAAIDAHEPNSFNESTNRIHAPIGPWSARDSTAAAAKNPVSVYNWLKRNNPELLEQNGDREKGGTNDGGTGAEKGGGGPAAEDGKKKERGPKAAPTKVMPKRTSVGAKHEYNEVLDEDGTVISVATEITTPSGPGRGRKRANVEEDGAYRPKGGSGRKKKKMSVGDKPDRASGLANVSVLGDADTCVD